MYHVLFNRFTWAHFQRCYSPWRPKWCNLLFKDLCVQLDTRRYGRMTKSFSSSDGERPLARVHTQPTRWSGTGMRNVSMFRKLHKPNLSHHRYRCSASTYNICIVHWYINICRIHLYPFYCECTYRSLSICRSPASTREGEGNCTLDLPPWGETSTKVFSVGHDFCLTSTLFTVLDVINAR